MGDAMLKKPADKKPAAPSADKYVARRAAVIDGKQHLPGDPLQGRESQVANVGWHGKCLELDKFSFKGDIIQIFH